jgi:hypothetical protein
LQFLPSSFGDEAGTRKLDSQLEKGKSRIMDSTLMLLTVLVVDKERRQQQDWVWVLLLVRGLQEAAK